MTGSRSDLSSGAFEARYRTPIARVAAIVLPLALAACASSPKTLPVGEGGSYKVGKPYQVAGVWYYPHEDEHYDATGIASWYGPQFHGKRTADGEIFDQESISAAHPTLPLPVLVRVTNLENGRSLVVRVNDRGPFVNGREIDLSRKAAELLGYVRQGTAKVRVQYVGRAPLPGIPGTDATQIASASGQETFIAPKPVTDESERHVAAVPSSGVVATALAAPVGVKVASAGVETAPVSLAAPASPTMKPVADPAPAPAPAAEPDTSVQHVPVAAGTNIYVQAGAFRSFANAEAVHQKLLAEGIRNVQVSSTYIDGSKFYRVRVGPLPDVSSADASLQSVIGKGHAGAKLVVD